MWTALGVLLPMAFAVGIAARKPVPTATGLPAGLAAASGQFTTVWEREHLFSRVAVRVRLLRDLAGEGRFAVSFSAPKDFVKPDLIVYWVAGHSTVGDTVPDKARLLGSFGLLELRLPSDAAAADDGSLILFSLADQQIVDVSKPTRFNDSTR